MGFALLCTADILYIYCLTVLIIQITFEIGFPSPRNSSFEDLEEWETYFSDAIQDVTEKVFEKNAGTIGSNVINIDFIEEREATKQAYDESLITLHEYFDEIL
jgi:hypothetical protein